MGGYGSGRWGRRATRKPTVEDCRCLAMSDLRGRLVPGCFGVWTWRTLFRIDEPFSVGYAVEGLGWDKGEMVVRLKFRVNNSEVEQSLGLANTRPNWGGIRRWFICPLSVNGVRCGRRVGKLYLGCRYFGCRHCHDLRYWSSQHSHQEGRLLRRAGY